MASSKCTEGWRNERKVVECTAHASCRQWLAAKSYDHVALFLFLIRRGMRNNAKQSQAGTWDRGSGEVSRACRLQNERTPAKRLNSSYVTQNVKDHGAMRAQMGKKPL